MNALPLDARVEHFAPENVFCPHCPYVVQSTNHFGFFLPARTTSMARLRFSFSFIACSVVTPHSLLVAVIFVVSAGSGVRFSSPGGSRGGYPHFVVGTYGGQVKG
jgi:hypothetical protein